MQRPLVHRNWLSSQVTFTHPVSSEKSPQSLSESQRKDCGMQRVELHWNSSFPQVGFVQFCSSSELSRQSSSPSHTQVLGIHRWLSQVKSQELGQAWTGGSTDGSLTQVFPSDCSFSPYGQPQRAVIPVAEEELSGTGKQSFWQPPLSVWQGWLFAIN